MRQSSRDGATIMRLYVIDYFAKGAPLASDCYPDFLTSLEEAKALAPSFGDQFDWISAFRVRSFVDSEDIANDRIETPIIPLKD
jgi:hypothetical protein